MAIFKTGNAAGKYFDEQAKEDVLHYILNPYKVKHGYCGSVNVDTQNPAADMQRVSERFGKTSGVQLRHFFLSFLPSEVDDPRTANAIGLSILKFFESEYQAVYAVHEDAANINIHIVINSVSYVDGHRYYGTKKEFYALMDYLRKALYRFGVNKLEYVSS